MRIALFTDTFAPNMNGVARTLTRWHGAMLDRGHQVRVFTTTVPGAIPAPDVTRLPSIAFWAYPELRLALPRFERVYRELRIWRPDVVHIATPFGVGLSGRHAALRLDVPIVTSYHTSLVEYARHYGLGALATPGMAFLRWFHNTGMKTFVPTRAIANELAARGFNALYLWTRGSDTVQFNPRHRDPELRARMGCGPDTVVVAYVGRLAREKSVHVACDAMREVTRVHDDVRFAVAGDGPDEARCRRRAPAGTWFAGRLGGAALSAFYASADLFVFPSTTDTFGNVLVEAMASGLPVIAADVPQSREVVGDRAGIFVAPDQPRAFARAITRFVDDRIAREDARRTAIARAQLFAWDSVFDRLIADYEEVLGITADLGGLAVERAPRAARAAR